MKKKKIILIVLIILVIGLTMVYSSSHIWAQYKENDALYYLKRQGLFMILGLILLFKNRLSPLSKIQSSYFNCFFFTVDPCFNSWYRYCPWRFKKLV